MMITTLATPAVRIASESMGLARPEPKFAVLSAIRERRLVVQLFLCSHVDVARIPRSFRLLNTRFDCTREPHFPILVNDYAAANHTRRDPHRSGKIRLFTSYLIWPFKLSRQRRIGILPLPGHNDVTFRLVLRARSLIPGPAVTNE